MTPIERLRLRLFLLIVSFATLHYSLNTGYQRWRELRASHSIPLYLAAEYSISTAILVLIAAVVLKSKSTKRHGVLGSHLAIPKVQGRLPGNIDILWQLVQGERTEYCANTLREWEAQYGPTFDMNILWGHQIVTSDPSNFKEILATGFSNFEKSTRFRDMLYDFLGDSVFTSDGDNWKRHRSIARPFFAHDKARDIELFEAKFDSLAGLIDNAAANSEPADMQALFARYTIDTSSQFLFGIDLDTLNGSQPRYKNLVTSFEELQHISMQRVRIGSNWPIFELFGDRSSKPAAVLNSFITPIVEQAFADSKPTTSKAGSVDDDTTYLQYLVKEMRDPKLVRDSVVSMLLAGRDTTTALLTFTTYCLATHPGVLAKLRDEVNEAVGESQRAPTVEEIRSMKYLKAIVHETLRLFPPVPLNIRRAAQTAGLPSLLSPSKPSPTATFTIPKNVSVTLAPFLAQRRKDVWGEDAEHFRPERWLLPSDLRGDDAQDLHKSDPAPEDYSQLTRVSSPFSFVPFNAGPRVCLGQSFALMECSYVLVRMIQRFQGSWDLVDSRQKLPTAQPSRASKLEAGRQQWERCWPRASLTLYVEGGVWMRFGSSK